MKEQTRFGGHRCCAAPSFAGLQKKKKKKREESFAAAAAGDTAVPLQLRQSLGCVVSCLMPCTLADT